MQEFLDFDNLESPRQRRARLLAEADARRAVEERVAAEAKERVDHHRDRANARALVREYRNAGVEPPYTNGHGIPTVSLSLLISNGWCIEEIGAERVLVKP